MPLNKVEFAPGLVKDETALAAEGGYVTANNIRFRQGKPETRGGWETAHTPPPGQRSFAGISRKQHAWSDLSGQPQMAWGTANNAYVLTGGAVKDITPPFIEGTALNPFSTVSGSPTVTVKITESGLKLGQTITFANAAPVGGLTINGPYTVSRVVTRDTFEITAASNATSTVANGGGGVDFSASMMPGLVDGTGGIGFGTGGWGKGPYGLPSVTDFMPTVWSMDNFGPGLLLLSPRGGALYGWQPAVSYAEILTQPWAYGTGWSGTGNTATATAGTASNWSQNIQNAAQGGGVYRVTFTATVTAGTVKLQVNAGTPTPALIDVGAASTPITRSGTYSRLVVMPANPSDLVFAKDSSFAGTISNVSFKLHDKAFIIPEAPRRIDSMFVDPHRTVCLFGTYEADGDYNPMLARWSGLENYRVWVPDTTNFAGEIAVASGSRIVRALASRGTNLIWTDTSLHGMQFTTDGFNVALNETGVGAIGINAVLEHQGIAYWWSNSNNFHRTVFDFQGAKSQLIDCRIREDVTSHLTPAQAEKIYASVNSEFSEIQWFYPDVRDGLECSRAAVYQFAENHWTTWAEARSSWVPAGVFVSPIACSTDGYLYYHERGITANGDPLPNYLETAYFDIEDGGNLMQMMGLFWDFARLTAPVRFVIKSKMHPNAPETVSGPYPIRLTQAAGSYRDQKVDFRRTGRQMAIRIEGETPWRMGVLRPIAKKSGAIR